MTNKTSACIQIQESTQVGEARRLISGMATQAGLPEPLRGQIAIIATELGNNLVKHTSQGGFLVIRSLEHENQAGIEILSLDRGPGIRNINRCMEDGYSTAGSPGTGLGAVVRLSSLFDIHSVPELGTAILSQVVSHPRPASLSKHLSDDASSLQIGAVCVPVRGEIECGDSWAAYERSGCENIMVVDGLGHGPQAAEASLEATRSFDDNACASPSDIVKAAHHRLRSTRGAALAVARIDLNQSIVHYCGLGNITGLLILPTGEQRRMVSHNGTAGIQGRSIHEFSYPWEKGTILIMHSDGLTTHWNLEKYPGLLTRHPALVAGVLYRDFSRDRDDITVVVARNSEKSSWESP